MFRSSRFRQLLLAFLTLSSLLLAAAILGDWLPHLRGPAPETSEWYWPYLLRPLQQWWPSLIAAILVLLISAWWLTLAKSKQSQTIIALVALFFSSLFLQVAVIYADRIDIAAELVERTLSNQASGFFEPAAEISDLNLVLATYPQEMAGFVSDHARTHPPGLILSNWATIQILSRLEFIADPLTRLIQPLRCTDLWLLNHPTAVPAALGIWAVLPLLFAASTLFPAYAVARQLLKGTAVRLATILAAMLPALILFAPKSVQLYAPLTLLMFWAFHSGIFQRSLWRLFFAGLLGSVLTFLSLGNMSLFLLFTAYGLLVVTLNIPGQKLDATSSWSWSETINQVLAFATGASVIWLLYWIIWGVAPWEIAVAGLNQHYQLVTTARRYEWWVGWNLIDLILFAGWPLMLGFIGAILLIFRRWRNGRLDAVDILALVLVVTILVLNFSGTARGEVGRLWLFFMPLLAFPSAFFWRKALPDKRSAVVLVGLQLLLILCLSWAWRPVRAVIVTAEAPLKTQDMPQHLIDAIFADEPIELGGYSLDSTRTRPGETLALTLFWEAGGSASRPYTTFNHIVDEHGTLIAQQDNWPVHGTWPPTCWQKGDFIGDDYQIAIPSETAPGSYRLFSGLYDAASGNRLLLEDGRDAVELGFIEIAPR